MRIACLQFAPQVGDVNNNLNRADAVLSRSNPADIDLLVLPELAFSGYNFKSLQHISPFLEPTAAGITSLWARTTALKYNCIVTVGYPEKVDVNPKWPTSPEYYNSAITVNAEGETIANYRKSFLYYTDETWALEGPDGFFAGTVPGLGEVAMGICMDLNPYKFEAPWNAWEFAYHVLHQEANLVILSMAWLTREDSRAYSRAPREPDMETLSYWLARLEPIIRAESVGEIIVVLANRTGTEDEATYAGTSAVLGIQDGEVKVYGILGRGERELLVVDTKARPQAKLVSEPNSAVSHASSACNTPSTSVEASRNSGLSVDTGITSPVSAASSRKYKSPIASPDTPQAMLGLGIGISTGSYGPEIASQNQTSQRKSSLIDDRKRARSKKVLSHPDPSDSGGDSRSSTPETTPISKTRDPKDGMAVDGQLAPTSPSVEERFPSSPGHGWMQNSRLSPRFVKKPMSELLEDATARLLNRTGVPEPQSGGETMGSHPGDTPVYTAAESEPDTATSTRESDSQDSMVGSAEVVDKPFKSTEEDQIEQLKLDLHSSLSGMRHMEPYQTSATRSNFGPRSAHTSPRPHSNVW